jgi:hypothetical protein
LFKFDCLSNLPRQLHLKFDFPLNNVAENKKNVVIEGTF